MNQLAELNQKINSLTDERQSNLIITRQIEQSQKRINDMEAELKGLFELYENEQKDVERLQKMSFQNFVHSLLNNKSETLDKEEREALEAKLKVDRKQSELEDERNHLSSLKRSHKPDSHYIKKIDTLLEEKRVLIRQTLPEKAAEMDRLSIYKSEKMMIQKELKEALEAGRRLQQSIQIVATSLQSAANWGTYDIIGGGMLATMAKHNHMREANEQFRNMEIYLKRFNAELNDVSLCISATLNIDGFLGFADYFFDGFMADLSVQSKIRDAQRQIQTLSNKIQSLVQKLIYEQEEASDQVVKIENQIKSIIRSV